ncbi:hypothetical protein ABGB14_30910 [Nonomuraea sp. B10E15]
MAIWSDRWARLISVSTDRNLPASESPTMMPCRMPPDFVKNAQCAGCRS